MSINLVDKIHDNTSKERDSNYMTGRDYSQNTF